MSVRRGVHNILLGNLLGSDAECKHFYRLTVMLHDLDGKCWGESSRQAPHRRM